MRNFKAIRLLTKTTLFYLIFIMLVFFISANYLLKKADKYVNEETEQIFNHRIKYINHFIEEHGDLKEFRGGEISLYDSIHDKNVYPMYSDTSIYLDELGDYQLHRQKTFVISANENTYLLKMLININDFTKLKLDVAHRIIPSFIILALVIILFSAFLSGYLLKPFYKILEQMNLYKVGKGSNIPVVKTSTTEFKKMQFLFKRMVNRTEDDYRKLKEYTENMAHEIQTPLTIIRNKTERLISDEKVMNEHKDSVKVIYDETNHLSKLGTTLNLLTKIENGEYGNTLNLKTKDIILKHVDSIKELVELKSLKIETYLDENHKIIIDPFLFDIILKNLLRNAIRYSTSEGPIKIETKNSYLLISNYGLELNVKNEKVFERFYTSDQSNQSLGLGLSLVKRICDLNQLQIEYNYLEKQHSFIIKPNNT